MASVVTNILSGGLLTGISSVINAIRGKSPEDAAKLAELAAKYQSELLAADVQQAQMQADINKAEATSGNWFVASWRPCVGYVCVLALLSEFVIRPFVIYGASLYGKLATYPSLDMGDLMTLLLGMLGLAGARTYEKVNGVSSGH